MGGGGYDNAAYHTPPLSRAHLSAGPRPPVLTEGPRPPTLGQHNSNRPQPIGQAGQ